MLLKEGREFKAFAKNEIKEHNIHRTRHKKNRSRRSKYRKLHKIDDFDVMCVGII